MEPKLLMVEPKTRAETAVLQRCGRENTARFELNSLSNKRDLV